MSILPSHSQRANEAGREIDLSHGNSRSIFRRKPIDEIPDDDHTLKRSIGLWQLTAIGVGGIIGAGIFSLAGAVASGAEGGRGVGPAVIISFLIAGLASAAAAFSYAEFAGLIPRAGSAYTYAYAVLGEIVGWVIGWDLLLEYTAIVAVVAIGISGYFNVLLQQMGVSLPAWAMGAPGTGAGHRIDLFAVILCLAIAFVLSLGMKSAARFETVVVVIKVAVVALVIVFGFLYAKSSNYHPFMPAGIWSTFGGAATVFFAVFGYDAMSTAAEEAEDAEKHMPKAILLSLAISMVLYVLACLALVGVQNYKQIDPTAGFASAFRDIPGLNWLVTIIALGAIVGILTVMLTFMLGVTRIWFAMSRDGLLPRWFAKTSKRTKAPVRVTWIVGVASAVLAGLLPIKEVAELTNIGILLAFILVCIAVIVMRYRYPDLPRSFRCPGMPVVPIIGILFSAWLVTFLSPWTWARFVGWFLIGLVFYVAYSYWHSALHRRRGVTEPAGPPEPPAGS